MMIWIGAHILEAATVALAIATFLLALTSRWESTRQIRLNMWLAFEKRFDSLEMKKAKRLLARQLIEYSQENHFQVSEQVLDFFESLGALFLHRLMNNKLADSTFSYYATHWWKAAQPYVLRKRLNKGDDTLYADFENLANAMMKRYPKISSEALATFLAEEGDIRSE